MRIGIITFHWGTNYGGVLQAYSLQQFLKKNIPDSEVFMINYAPKTHSESIFKCVATKSVKQIPSNLITYFKEKKFVLFREKYLATTKRYYSLAELTEDYPKLDVYICGSDQVWNPYIVSTYGLPYFLPFGDESIKRISYAVSFGCMEYPKEKMAIVKPLIEKFNSLSVRENTGLEILKKAGINNAQLMPDPTILLEKDDLELLVSNINNDYKDEDFVFFYSLQDKQYLIKQVDEYVSKAKGLSVVNTKNIKFAFLSIENWLSSIRNSKFVVTNSFHGVVFSILFQKQFVVIPIDGPLSGMNDRIYTLLDKFQLKSQILEQYDETRLESIISNRIDWSKVETIHNDLKIKAKEFLFSSIFS